MDIVLASVGAIVLFLFIFAHALCGAAARGDRQLMEAPRRHLQD